MRSWATVRAGAVLFLGAVTWASPVKADHPEKAPSDAKPGKVYLWKSADGLPFEYAIPKGYDEDKGANLTLVLHGNGLDHRWAFANHPVGTFRADDIVVSPDGTSPHAGLGTNEFLGGQKDADRLHAFIEELRAQFNVKKVFLYGHSQGSFFVFFYAGAYPDDVDGVLGHASGSWASTRMGKFGHHQAVAIMHGTEDHIPYGQSVGTRNAYEDAKYPHVHLRTLWGWPHAPHHPQASTCLAWCEAMVSDEPDRVAVSLELLADDTPLGPNLSALFDVASKLAEMKQASASQKKAANKALARVEKAAEACVEAIDKALGKKGRIDRFPEGDASWLVAVPRFLADFRGTAAEEAFSKTHKKALAAQEKAASKAMTTWWKERQKDPAKAFAAGMELLDRGCLNRYVAEVVTQMAAWAEDPKEHGIPPKSAKDFLKRRKAYDEGIERGLKAYESRMKKA